MMAGIPASQAAFLMKLLRVDGLDMTLTGIGPDYLNARRVCDLSAASKSFARSGAYLSKALFRETGNPATA
jgi:hypothetical protein